MKYTDIILSTPDGLKALKAIYREWLREQYPNVPESGLHGLGKFSAKDTNGITHCITTLLNTCGCYCVRVNTQGQWNEKLQKWTKGHTPKGTADLLACIGGTFFSFEIKRGYDKLTPEQEATRERVQASGGVYLVIYEYQTFYNWLRYELAQSEGVISNG